VGSFLNEIVFDYRSRVKQNRLNEFIDLLSEEFSKRSHDEVDFKKMESDEFGDLFESI
jgi:lipoate-protein ligase A